MVHLKYNFYDLFILYNFILFLLFLYFNVEYTIGGNEGGVIYFDNDYRFCMPRLISILEKRVRQITSVIGIL